MDRTGIDLDGEATGVFAEEEFHRAGPGLLRLRPELHRHAPPDDRRQAACINGGRLIAALCGGSHHRQRRQRDYQHDNTPVRQVISEATSAQVRVSWKTWSWTAAAATDR